MVDWELVLVRDVRYFILLSELLILSFEFIKVTFLLSSLSLSFSGRDKSVRCNIECRQLIVVLSQVEVSSLDIIDCTPPMVVHLCLTVHTKQMQILAFILKEHCLQQVRTTCGCICTEEQDRSKVLHFRI